MPPHLHPRSTATSTLFAGTLLASFTVVAIPHIFPCPRPRRAYADAERQLNSEGRPIRRKRRKSDEQPQTAEAVTAPKAPEDTLPPHRDPTVIGGAAAHIEAGSTAALLRDPRLEDEAALFRQFQEEAKMLEQEARECPVPKPRGVLGRLLGFQQDGKEEREEVAGRGTRTDLNDA